MPIEIAETIVFNDECSIQECEALLGALQKSPPLPVDLRPCRSMHSALFQLLIAVGERPMWGPSDPGLNELLAVRLAWTEPSVKTVRKSSAKARKESQ
jgi:hypothetical protein